MRALTSEEIGLVWHVCFYGWVGDDVTLDREKLAAQIKYLTAEQGCQVDSCPCLDFAYRGEEMGSEAFAEKLEADFASDRATDETQLVVVMDVKDSPWQVNLFVVDGIIGWLEFSSFSGEYPVRLPAVSELC